MERAQTPVVALSCATFADIELRRAFSMAKMVA